MRTSLLFTFSLLLFTFSAARATEPVSYLDWDDANGKMTNATLSATDYELVTSETREFEDGKWYVVADDVVIESGGNIKVSGSARLILCDNASLTINGGSVTATGGEFGAGIGGGFKVKGGYITVCGGTVEASGGHCGAGIGGYFGRGVLPDRGVGAVVGLGRNPGEVIDEFVKCDSQIMNSEYAIISA